MTFMEVVREVGKMGPVEFRKRILIPILEDRVAISILTFGNLDHIDDVAIDKFREKINNLSFGEFAEGKEDVLRFIQVCSAKTAEISRLN